MYCNKASSCASRSTASTCFPDFIMRALPSLLAFCLAAGLLPAQSDPAHNIQQPQEAPTIFSRVRGIFDIDLPRMDPPGTIKLLLRPHVGDLVRRDYLRTEVGLRWAVNDRLELSSEVTTFVSHGLGGADEGNGLGEVRFGSKYIFREWPWPGYEASLSFNAEVPVGRPPIDLTDGFNHYIPGIVIQHRWKTLPRLTTFGGTQVEFLTTSSVPGTLAPNTPRDDTVGFTLGGIYDLGQLKWTLSGTYATTRLIGGVPENFYYLRPSLLWYVPKKFTFNSKTQWIVGFGTPLTWGPAGFEFKATTRVRAEITFRQVLKNMRDRNAAK